MDVSGSLPVIARRHRLTPRITYVRTAISAAGAALLIVLSAALGALSVELGPAAVLLLAAVLFGLVIALRPDTATLVAVPLIYSNALVVGMKFHDFPRQIGEPLPIALLLIPFVFYIVLQRAPLIVTPVWPMLLVFSWIMLVSAALSTEQEAARQWLSIFVTEGLILYLFVTNVVRDRVLLERLVWLLVLIGGALGAVSVIQAAGGYASDYLGFAQTGGRIGNRAAGPIGEQNRYAQVLLVLLPLGLFLARARRTHVAPLVAVGASALIAAGVVLTLSRGAIVGAIAVLLVVLVFGYAPRRQVFAIAAALVALALVLPGEKGRIYELGALPAASLEAGAANAADGSTRGRAGTMAAAALVVRDHPLFGVGPGAFPQYYRDYAETVGLRIDGWTRQAHSLYLGMAAEGGVLGLLAFLAVIAVTMRELARARRRVLEDDQPLAELLTGFQLAIVAYLVTGLFLHLAYERYFWLLLALAGVTAVIGNRRSEDVTDDGVAQSSAAAARRSISATK